MTYYNNNINFYYTSQAVFLKLSNRESVIRQTNEHRYI